MRTSEAGATVRVKNILFLTDFSEPSEVALPFATAFGRNQDAKIHALHVLQPVPYSYSKAGLVAEALEAAEETAQSAMQRLSSQLSGLQYETTVVRGAEVWPAVDHAIQEGDVDLIILGTHGRTGPEKLLLGSVAEEIFRRSPVPVLTIGPGIRSGAHNGGRFHQVMFATDFTPESLAGAPFALSLARENQAHLALLTVMRKPEKPDESDDRIFELSVAEAFHRLYELVPEKESLRYPPQALVEYGDAAERIVEVAKQRGVDLIVLGVRSAAGRLGAATHLERAIAHKVVARATCPVLTFRG